MTGGDEYTFGANMRVYQTDGGKGEATLRWFDDTECQSESHSDKITAASSGWQRTRLAVTVPIDAVAARISLSAAQATWPSTISEVVYFDDVSLARGTPAENTTTTLRGCTADCGDPVADSFPSTITSSDALYTLLTAVHERTCAACICDVNGSGEINATDALLTLAVAVGETVTLNCSN